MIKLFVLDVDGCISYPFKTPDWDTLTKIRNLNLKSRQEPDIPSITLCTGRPYPYAEAVAQWLDIRHPFIFESAGLYHWDGNRIETGIGGNTANGQGMNSIHAFKEWLTESVIPDYPDILLEFTKMMDAGVVSPNTSQIDQIYNRIMEHVEKNYPELEVHRTEISVNTLLAGNNKGTGIELLSRELGISSDQMAYIGDSEGDLPALEKVARPFAPLNAIERVKEVAEVLPYETSGAILEAYQRLIKQNK